MQKKVTTSLLLTVIVGLSVFTPNSFAKLIYVNRVQGLNKTLLTNVMTRFKTQQSITAKNLNADIANNWFYNGKKNIKLALQPYGYFNPHIKQQLQKTGNQWQAIYHITPGPQTKITRIDLQLAGEGKMLTPFLRLRENFPLKAGDVYSSTKYDDARDKLLELANRLGFLDSVIKRGETLIERRKNTAHIIINFDTGPRYYIGEITFNKTPFNESFLRRFLNIKSGQPYLPRRLIALQQNLANSDYFKRIDVHGLTKKAKNHRIPIKIHLTAYPSQQYLYGLGYGTDTRFRGTLGINFRRLTRTGQHFSSILQASHAQSALEAKYTIPGANPLVNEYTLGAAIENIAIREFRSRTEKLNVSYVTNHKVWQQTIGLTAQRDKFSLGDGISRKVNTLYPSLSIMRLFTDNPIRTMNGSRINLHMLGGSRFIGSQIHFFQVQLLGKVIKSLYPGGRLVFRGNMGHTSVNDRGLLPLSLQFFAGGAQSVRGYSFMRLGPGRSTLIGSAEFQQQIVGNWYGAAFFDAGNAFNGNFFVEASRLRKSAGVGLMVMTAVGPIELSIAKPLGDPNARHFRVQFSIGPDL